MSPTWRRHAARCVVLLHACGFFAVTVPANGSEFLVQISTGSVAGIYYQIGVDICREINKRRHDHGIWCSVEASKGSEENIERLLSGSSEFAIVQSDVVAAFKQDRGTDIVSVALLHTEKLHAFIRPGAGIQGYGDLYGKRVNVGEVGSGTRFVVDKLFGYLGLEAEGFALLRELDPVSQIEAFCSDHIDVSFWMAAAPNPIGDELTSSCSAQLLGLSDDEAGGLSRTQNLVTGQITPEHYVTANTPVLTVQVDALLIASPELAEGVTARVTAAIAESQVSLRRNSRFLGSLQIRTR